MDEPRAAAGLERQGNGHRATATGLSAAEHGEGGKTGVQHAQPGIAAFTETGLGATKEEAEQGKEKQWESSG